MQHQHPSVPQTTQARATIGFPVSKSSARERGATLSSRASPCELPAEHFNNRTRSKWHQSSPQAPAGVTEQHQKGTVHRPGTRTMHPAQPCCSRAVGTTGFRQHRDQRTTGTVPGDGCGSRPAAADAAEWVPTGQDAPRVNGSALPAAPLSKTTDIFHAVALAVGGMSTDVEQGRDLLPQWICLGMVRVRRRPRRQPGRSPGSTSPVFPCSWDGRDGAGKASTLSRPAFTSLLESRKNWEMQRESQLHAGRMGASGP